MHRIAFLLCVLVVPMTLMADEVHLKNGNKLEGIAREEGDRVIVELGAGNVTLWSSEVEKIVVTKSPLHEYQERLQKIEKSTTADDFVALALWARANGMPRYAVPLLEKAITLDPDHPAARGMLGYVFLDSRWMTKAESMEAQGFVEFLGGWVTRAERDGILAAEAARREKARNEAEARRAQRPQVRTEIPTLYLGVSPYRDLPNRQRFYSRYRSRGGRWYAPQMPGGTHPHMDGNKPHAGSHQKKEGG